MQSNTIILGLENELGRKVLPENFRKEIDYINLPKLLRLVLQTLD